MTNVFDGNGNPTTCAGNSQTFDVENRLTASYGSTTYGYRADGLRTWMQTSFLGSTEKRHYLYDQGNVVCELNAAGSVVATNVYAPDGLVGRTNGTTTWQYLFDWQGNAAHSMTSSTTVAMSAGYNAWGQRNYVYPLQTPSQWDDCMGYNARWGYLQSSGGFYYCQNRYYDPANGRWLTRDPIGFAGGMNVYGYCGGGPVGATDPDGAARVKVISYRVFGPGWHRGIVVEDTMGRTRAYSFAGGPERFGGANNGGLESKSGPWKAKTMDYDWWHDKPEDERRTITLIDDCSSYDSWVDRFMSIEAEIGKRKKKSYAPLPSDSNIYGGGTANSNTWAHYLLRHAGLMDEYDHAIQKLPGGDLPWAPGWNIKEPFEPE